MTYIASVIAPTTITWDGGPVRLGAGAVVTVEPGGTLETAIGAGNLQTLTGDGQNVPAAAGAVSN